MNDAFIVFIILAFVISSFVKYVGKEQNKARQTQKKTPADFLDLLQSNNVTPARYPVNPMPASDSLVMEGNTNSSEGTPMSSEASSFDTAWASETAEISTEGYSLPEIRNGKPLTAGQSMEDLFTEGTVPKEATPVSMAQVQRKKAPVLSLHKNWSPIMQGIVYSEVLGKPKALKED